MVVHYTEENRKFDTILEIKEFLDSKYRLLGAGRHRHTYLLDEETVIKLPLTRSDWDYGMEYCIEANILEVTNYNNISSENKDKYAECGLIFIKGIPLVIMEYIDRAGEDFCEYDEDGEIIACDGPDWIEGIDRDSEGYQVGFSRDGQLKAFDYSHDVAHD